MDESFADRVTATAAQLVAWCRTEGHHVCPDNSVYEPVAALLIDRAPATLNAWRSNGGANVPYYRGSRSGRVRYRILDLATHIELQRQNGLQSTAFDRVPP